MNNSKRFSQENARNQLNSTNNAQKMYSYPTSIAKGKIKNLVIKIRKHGRIEALNRYQHTTPRPIILQLNMIHNQSYPYFVNPSV